MSALARLLPLAAALNRRYGPALKEKLKAATAADVTGALVVGLVAADLLTGGGRSDPAPQRGEVQNYALFTTVKDRGVAIVTGTQFASTTDRRIVSQWCYMTRDAGDGSLTSQLTLATATPTGRVTRADITSGTLAAFGFDGVSPASFIDAHCRFQR